MEELKKRWYVIHAFSGQESNVMREIELRTKKLGMDEKIGQVLVPSEEVVEMKSGQKRKTTRKFYPGYVLVNMVMDDETWHMIRAIPRVLGFIGGNGQMPSPISEKEAQEIIRRIEEGISKPKPKVLFEPGEVVRVKEGPFIDFTGVVEEVNYEKNKLRVAVLIFGRSTPVELEFGQVEKT